MGFDEPDMTERLRIHFPEGGKNSGSWERGQTVSLVGLFSISLVMGGWKKIIRELGKISLLENYSPIFRCFIPEGKG